MDIQIKQEVCADKSNTNEYSEYCTMEPDVIVKEEDELIIEDYHQDQACSSVKLEDAEKCPEYQVDGYSIQFIEEMEDNNDIGYLNEFSDVEGDDYMQDDEEDDSHGCNGKVKKPKCRKAKIKLKFGNADEKCDKFSDVYKKVVKLQNRNHIRVLCPLCEQNMKLFAVWARHLNEKHTEFSDYIKSNYDFKTLRRAVCKHCNETLTFHVNHFLHYLTYHCPDSYKLFLCNVCNHKDISMERILKHIDEKHTKLNDLHRMCPLPLCNITLADGTSMRQHFRDEHYAEFKTKFEFYNCHLCNHPRFDKESHYYDHLMNLHGLYGYDWEQLNFKQMCDGEQHFECTKCSRICVNTGPHNLLEHYLTHENNIYWCCKYCHSKFEYKESLHLCKQMYKCFNKNEVHVQDVVPARCIPSTGHKIPQRANRKSEDWHAFEAYIIHTCPFCNEEFDKFFQWQLHLRQKHHINTLKGLDMAVVENDPDRFRCLQCDTLIQRSSTDLHTHRFQHLKHMPYKCRHCSKSLENGKIALRHVVNRCAAAKDPSSKDDGDDMVIRRPKLSDDDNNWTEILCALCKNEQFSSVADIEMHFKRHHNNFEGNYLKSANNLDMVCKICKTTLRSVSSDVCLSHYIKHLKEGPYKCLYCERSYKAIDVCTRHIRRFHMLGAHYKKPNSFTPTHPKKNIMYNESITSATKTGMKLEISELKNSTLQQHINNGLGTLSFKANILNEFQEFIKFACAECNASFDMQNAWNDHVKMQHNFFNDSELSVVDSTDGKHRCKHCNLVLDSSISHRQKHKLTHMPHKSFVCVVCDNRCTTLGLLYGHLRRLHFFKGTFECPICLVNLTTSYERSEHVIQSHPRSEWPENMCLICYRNYTSLSTHMLSHDINRPRHMCQVCGVGIVNLKDFQKHMERKHNEKIKPIVPAITDNDDGAQVLANDGEESPNKRRSRRNIGKDIEQKSSRLQTTPTNKS